MCIKKYKNLDISMFLTILKVENYAYTHNTPQKHPKKGQNYAYMHMHVRIILLNSMHIRITNQTIFYYFYLFFQSIRRIIHSVFRFLRTLHTPQIRW